MSLLELVICYLFVMLKDVKHTESTLILSATSQHAIINQEFVLVCKTYGESIDAIRWRLNGEKIASITGNSCTVGAGSSSWYKYSCAENEFSLTIPKNHMTENQHMSVWSCANLIGGGMSNFTIHLKLPVSNLRITDHTFRMVKITDGDQVRLICEAGPCRPIANITWIKGNKEFNSESTQFTRDESSDTFITISNWTFIADRTDNGLTISCRAININDYGYTSSKSLRLHVQYGPGDSIRLSETSLTINVTENTSLKSLQCRASCNPVCQYLWLKDRVKISEDATLELVNVTREEGGQYKCLATNMFAKANHTSEIDLWVRVLYPAMIEDLYTADHDNDSLNVYCNVSSQPLAHVMWFNNDVLLESVLSSTTGTLTLKDSCSDNGNYTCKADNSVGKPDSKSIEIEVHCKPTPLKLDSHQQYQIRNLDLGSSLELNVMYVAFPTPWEVWYFDSEDPGIGIEMISSDVNFKLSRKSRISCHNFSLILPIIKKKNFGEYTIIVGNHLGNSSVTFAVMELETTRESESNNIDYLHFISIGSSVIFAMISGLIGTVIVKLKLKKYRLQRHKKKDSEKRKPVPSSTSSDQSTDKGEIGEYENKGRIIELSAPEPYDDLEDGNDDYEESHYSNIKDHIENNIEIPIGDGEICEKSSEERKDYTYAMVHKYIEIMDGPSSDEESYLEPKYIENEVDGTKAFIEMENLVSKDADFKDSKAITCRNITNTEGVDYEDVYVKKEGIDTFVA